MQRSTKPGVLLWAMLSLVCAAPATWAAEIGDDRLQSATEARGDWLHYGRDYGQPDRFYFI